MPVNVIPSGGDYGAYSGGGGGRRGGGGYGGGYDQVLPASDHHIQQESLKTVILHYSRPLTHATTPSATFNERASCLVHKFTSSPKSELHLQEY